MYIAVVWFLYEVNLFAGRTSRCRSNISGNYLENNSDHLISFGFPKFEMWIVWLSLHERNCLNIINNAENIHLEKYIQHLFTFNNEGNNEYSSASAVSYALTKCATSFVRKYSPIRTPLWARGFSPLKSVNFLIKENIRCQMCRLSWIPCFWV